MSTGKTLIDMNLYRQTPVVAPKVLLDQFRMPWMGGCLSCADEADTYNLEINAMASFLRHIDAAHISTQVHGACVGLHPAGTVVDWTAADLQRTHLMTQISQFMAGFPANVGAPVVPVRPVVAPAMAYVDVGNTAPTLQPLAIQGNLDVRATFTIALVVGHGNSPITSQNLILQEVGSSNYVAQHGVNVDGNYDFPAATFVRGREYRVFLRVLYNDVTQQDTAPQSIVYAYAPEPPTLHDFFTDAYGSCEISLRMPFVNNGSPVFRLLFRMKLTAAMVYGATTEITTPNVNGFLVKHQFTTAPTTADSYTIQFASENSIGPSAWVSYVFNSLTLAVNAY